MIRHHHGSEFWLVTQNDHALLSGHLAERMSGRVIARPAPQTIRGIALHDCGWPLHDDAPTVNARGEPLHVFEAPPPVATRVWSESARLAVAEDAYAGLLVSLHVLNLSVMSMASHKSPHDVFELNKFQHRQVELQEGLRRRLGFRVDVALTHGLAELGASPEEDALLFDYRLLRAMDQLSLALLCSEHVFDALDGIHSRPGAAPINIRIHRLAEFTMRLDPWPFDAALVELTVPFRRVVAGAYATDQQFRLVYAAAGVEEATVRVVK